MPGYTVKNLKDDVENQAVKFGFAPDLEAHFATRDLGLEMATLHTAGLTDAEIALTLVRQDGEGDPAAAARLLDEYAGLGYGLEELEACEPWLTLAELPAPPELERIIGLEDGVRD